MKRREFLATVGGAIASPFAARAQDRDRVRRIGVLMGLPDSDPDVPPRIAALKEGLRN